MSAAASRFVVGLEGPSLSAGERSEYSKRSPFGFVLSCRNLESAGQAAELIAELRTIADPAPLLFVDQEGGTVDRLGPLLGQRFASPASLALAGAHRVHSNAYLMGRACRLLGFDVDLAPCVDLGLPRAGEVVLAGRTSGLHAEDVVLAGVVFLHGLARAGMACCLKHFPGLGRGIVDTHVSLPVIEAHDVDLMVTDVLPFIRLASLADAVMVGHAAYPELSRDGAPASLSPEIVSLVRGAVGFRGVVLCDDLSMHALPGPVPRRALRAAAAGCDLLILSRPGEDYEESVARVEDLAPREPAVGREGRESRLQALREKCRMAPRPPFGREAWDRLASEVEAFNRQPGEPRETGRLVS